MLPSQVPRPSWGTWLDAAPTLAAHDPLTPWHRQNLCVNFRNSLRPAFFHVIFHSSIIIKANLIIVENYLVLLLGVNEFLTKIENDDTSTQLFPSADCSKL